MKYQGLFIEKINYLPLFVACFFWISSLFIDINNVGYKFLSLLFLILIPGLYLSAILRDELSLNFDEFIIINIVISNSLLLWLYILLTLFFNQVTRFLLLQTSCLLILCEFLLYQINDKQFKFKVDIKSFMLCWLCSFFPFLVGGYFAAHQTPEEYWIGWDTWETVTVSKRLVELSLSPYEAVEQFRAYLSLWNFGFPYFVTMVSKFTGFRSEEIVRYGPIALSGLFCVLSYLLFKRISGTLVGVLSGTLVLLNPWIGIRFAMLLRENFSIILMLSSFLLVIILEKKNDNKNKPASIFIHGLFLASSLISHMLPIVINLTVIALEIGNYYIERNFLKMKNIVASIIVMSVFILPFYGFFTYPIKNLFLLSNENMFRGFFIFIFSMSVIYIVISKNILSRIKLNHRYITTIFITTSVLIFILSIIKPSLFHIHPNFDYIKWNLFNRLILFTGILGIAYKISTKTNRLVLYLMGFITATIIASLIGFQVPLNRLIIYISLVATYFSSVFFEKIMVPYENELMLDQLITSKWKEYGRIFFIIILLATQIYSGINQIGGNNRYPSSYSSSNIESAKEFILDVGDNDIIFPIETSHIFEYIETSKTMMINTLDEKKWMLESYNNNAPDDLLKNVPDSRKNINRIHYCITENLFYSKREISPSRNYLNRYCEKTVYGSLLVFSISLPYDRNHITHIKNITLCKDPMMSNLINSGEKYIVNPSNIIYINNSKPHYRVYYTIKGDADEYNGIGLAYSRNGLNWTKSTDPIICGPYDNPYVIRRDDGLILFCKSLQNNSIVSMISKEGDNWTNITEIIKPNTSCLYWSADSPIAWEQNHMLNLIYTETMLDEHRLSFNLIRVNSSNGLTWGNNETVIWDIFDESDKYLRVDKILLKDVILLKDGLYFSCRVFSEGKTLKVTWKTGSIFVKNDAPHIGIFLKYNYINFQGEDSNIESVRIEVNKNTSDVKFYVWLNESNLKGLYLGT